MILLIKEHTLIHSWADLLHFFVLFGRLSSLVQVLCVYLMELPLLYDKAFFVLLDSTLNTLILTYDLYTANF